MVDDANVNHDDVDDNQNDVDADANDDDMGAVKVYLLSETKSEMGPSYPYYLPLMDFLREWGLKRVLLIVD